MATPTVPAVHATCIFCGKTLTRTNTVKAGMGHKCAQLAQKFTPATLAAHYAKITVSAIPAGYIALSTFRQIVPANVGKIPGLTISKLVRAIGGDRGTGPLANPIAQPYYLAGKNARYVHPWLGTPAGLLAIATGQWAQAPTPTFTPGKPAKPAK